MRGEATDHPSVAEDDRHVGECDQRHREQECGREREPPPEEAEDEASPHQLLRDPVEDEDADEHRGPVRPQLQGDMTDGGAHQVGHEHGRPDDGGGEHRPRGGPSQSQTPGDAGGRLPHHHRHADAEHRGTRRQSTQRRRRRGGRGRQPVEGEPGREERDGEADPGSDRPGTVRLPESLPMCGHVLSSGRWGPVDRGCPFPATDRRTCLGEASSPTVGFTLGDWPICPIR